MFASVAVYDIPMRLKRSSPASSSSSPRTSGDAGRENVSARIHIGLLEYDKMLVVGSKRDFLSLTESELANPSDY
jgi:hypothetical protein